MIDLEQFKALSKQSSKSYNDQKALIKKVLAGREMYCKSCKQILEVKLPENLPSSNTNSASVENDESAMGIRCAKGCTDISLDFAV